MGIYKVSEHDKTSPVPEVAKQQAIDANSQRRGRHQSLNPSRRYIARQPEPGTNINEAARKRQRTIEAWKQRESGYGFNVTKVLAHVVGFPRKPNSVEASKLNAMLSIPTDSSRMFEYVQFRATASPTDCLPIPKLLIPGSYIEDLVVGLLPWAWYEIIDSGGSYSSGNLIRIAYGDPINRMDPYVIQNTGGSEGDLSQLTYDGFTAGGLKAAFYNGIGTAQCIRPRRPTPGRGETWQQKGFLRGKEYTFEATMFGRHILDVRAAKAFSQMRERAAKEGVNIKINSAFRLPEEQEYFYCKYKQGTGNVAARPGYSNHQSGVAMDLNTEGAPNDKAIRRKTKISTGQGKVYEWLTKNAAKYGFRRIKIEHWHWEHIPSLNANLQKIKNSKKKEI